MYSLEQFESLIISSSKPIFVYAFAKWCIPCKQSDISFTELESEYKDKLKFIKLDFDKDEEILKKYVIKGVPAFVLFKDGKIITSKIGGSFDKNKLSAAIDSNI